ncbi:FHA domain-containing protein, partial [Mycobacterium avium]
MVLMSPPATPALTVRYDGAERTFAAGNDVVIGRDLRADLRVAHPLISRTHLIVRYEQGRWVAIDNGSLNGLYVNNRRVPMVDINDGTRVNMGNPDGPALSFEVGRHQGSAGRPPLTTSIPIVSTPSGPMTGAAQGQPPGTQRISQPQQPASSSFRQPVQPPTGAQPSHPPSGPTR